MHFRLLHNGQEILNYPGVTSDRDRILQAYRPAFLNKSTDLYGRTAGCVLSGVIVDPVHARSSKTPQDLFVNRRPVRNSAVFHAVSDGYGSLLPKGNIPTFVLFLEIDPDRIDVNVHPAKREIRFADQEGIHRFVRHAVRHAISGPERTVLLNRESREGVTAPVSAGLSSTMIQKEEESPSQSTGERVEVLQPAPFLSGSTSQNETPSLFAQEGLPSYVRSSALAITPFGQIKQTYLVAQVGQELQVIDQHTSHERVLFQRLWRKWSHRELASQPLLIPEPIELSAGQSALFQKHVADLEQLGIFIEPFGTTAIVLRAVPAGLGQLDGALLVQDLLDDLTQWDSISSLEARAQPIMASLACRNAVQAGRSMALPEMEQLFRDWIEEGLIMTCPHGRRTAFRISTSELDKLFGRVGWL